MLAILVLLGLITLSGSSLLAWVYTNYAINTETHNDRQRSRAEAAVDLAIKLWPIDSEYYNQRGLMAVRVGDLATAEDAYKHSLRLRPTWPYSWANLSQYWLVRGQTGTLFTSLWQHSLELGPAEDRLHLAFSRIGLEHWYRLNPIQRELLQKSLAYLLTAPNAATSLNDLQKYAHRRQLQTLLCRLGGTSVNLREWCEQYQSTF